VLGDPTHLFQSDEPRRVAILDWNGDGRNDLLFDTRDALVWREQRADGTLAPHQRILRDGLIWLAVVRGPQGPRALVHGNDGFGVVGPTGAASTATQVEPLALPLPWNDALAVVTADGNGDGYDEGYFMPLSGDVLRWDPRNGTTCSYAPVTHALRRGVLSGAADVDLDGKVDFLAPATCAGCTSDVQVWLAR
jgi:hypothetical protein